MREKKPAHTTHSSSVPLPMAIAQQLKISKTISDKIRFDRFSFWNEWIEMGCSIRFGGYHKDLQYYETWNGMRWSSGEGMPRMSDGPSGRGGARNRYIEKQKRPEESNGVRAHNKHIVLNERRAERERERKPLTDSPKNWTATISAAATAAISFHG